MCIRDRNKVYVDVVAEFRKDGQLVPIFFTWEMCIRDRYKVLTYRDKDVRRVVALEKAHAKTEEEAIADPEKSKVFYQYMDCLLYTSRCV